MTKIIPATSIYNDQIRKIHLASFPDASEADLVDNLRKSGDAEISLIAVDDNGEVIGHVMFSKLTTSFKALSLAPVAVDKNHRKQGIAEKLIRAGLEIAKGDGWEGAVVLGNPNYYQRFGFSLKLAEHFDCPYSGPHLMALELQSNSMPTHCTIEYPTPFDEL